MSSITGDIQTGISIATVVARDQGVKARGVHANNRYGISGGDGNALELEGGGFCTIR